MEDEKRFAPDGSTNGKVCPGYSGESRRDKIQAEKPAISEQGETRIRRKYRNGGMVLFGRV